MPSKPSKVIEIELPRIAVERMEVKLIGDSPLICHNWSEKAKRQMLDKQMKKAKQAKEAKDPEGDFRGSLYPLGDGYGFPAVAFKSAAVSACRWADGVKMTEARGAFHVIGEMIKIDGPEPTMREDTVKIALGTADLRYRGQFDPWRVTLTVSYNVNAFSAEQIINLFNLAGFGVGVGDWRPEKDGSYGRFHVATERE